MQQKKMDSEYLGAPVSLPLWTGALTLSLARSVGFRFEVADSLQASLQQETVRMFHCGTELQFIN
jgi:hypothetical protein